MYKRQVPKRSPPIDSPIAPKPGLSAIGPVWPKPDSRNITSEGLIADSSSQPRPNFSSTPGRTFLITTSASAHRRRTNSAPFGCVRGGGTAWPPRVGANPPRFGGGTSEIPNRLAALSPDHFVLGVPVVLIEQSAPGVAVRGASLGPFGRADSCWLD